MKFDHAIVLQVLIGEAEPLRHLGRDHRVGCAGIQEAGSFDTVELERQFQPACSRGKPGDRRGRFVPGGWGRLASPDAIQRQHPLRPVDVKIVIPQDVQAEDAVEWLVAAKRVHRQPVQRQRHSADRHAVDAGVWLSRSATQTHQGSEGSRVADQVKSLNRRLAQQAFLRARVQQHADRVAVEGDRNNEEVVLELKWRPGDLNEITHGNRWSACQYQQQQGEPC